MRNDNYHKRVADEKYTASLLSFAYQPMDDPDSRIYPRKARPTSHRNQPYSSSFRAGRHGCWDVRRCLFDIVTIPSLPCRYASWLLRLERDGPRPSVKSPKHWTSHQMPMSKNRLLCWWFGGRRANAGSRPTVSRGDKVVAHRQSQHHQQ
jgi:hypothetical protein